MMKINLRRTMLIARQDFMGYIKTWGFWLTAIGPFIGLIVGVFMPFIMMSSEPVRYVSILDETKMHAEKIEKFVRKDNEEALKFATRKIAKYTIPRDKKGEFNRVLDEQGVDAAIEMIRKTSPAIAERIKMPESKIKFVPLPADSFDEIQPYLKGEKLLNINGKQVKLDGLLYIIVNDRQLDVQYWTTNASRAKLASIAKRYFRQEARNNYLAERGVDYKEYKKSISKAPAVTTLNPLKSMSEEGGQEVTLKDKIPYMVAAGFAMLLWLSVFSGAYMLLVSMLEEKMNKILEMLLASTRFSEIFFGKLLGVAVLTIASLLPWIIIGALGFYAAITFGDSSIADGLAKAITPKLLFFLPVFFILGYVFYGAMFIAMGALSDSMQDASTLMTPMVLVLTACIIVVPIGISYPDSPVLKIAAWIPFSAPFAAVIRLAGDAPLWETMGSVMVLLVSCGLVVWGSSRLLQHGVLASNAIATIKAKFSRIIPFYKKNN